MLGQNDKGMSRILLWVKVQNLKKPELRKFKSKIFHYAYKITISCLNDQLPLDKQLRYKRSDYNLPSSVF